MTKRHGVRNHRHPVSRETFAAMSRRMMLKAGTAALGLGAAWLATTRRGAIVAAQETPLPDGTPGAEPAEAEQSGEPPSGPPGGNDAAALAEPFVGITTDGAAIPGLFSIQASGVSTEAVQDATEAFLASLDTAQREATQFAVDDDEWRKWSNVDGYQRQGVSLREMSAPQREAAMGLLTASLSAAGLEKTQNTIKLNHTEGELMDNFAQFDEDLYWFTIMGEPSPCEPYGWQLDGHHLVINYVVLGDQVVMAPVFMGAEPTIAPEGTDYAGLSVLIPEQDKGLSFINTFSDEQRAQAIVDPVKSGSTMQAGAFSDNAVIPYAGIAAAELTADQQAQLLDLVAEYVGNLDDGHAAVKMDEVRSHLDETHFAWIGETGAESVFYYRMQSPVILIELDHQEPGPLGRMSDYYQGATGPQRAHIHTVVRTPNGNDYGKDLLAEHYATSPHHAGETARRGYRLSAIGYQSTGAMPPV